MTELENQKDKENKILFVDDEVVFLELIKEIFTYEGIKISTTDNPFEAIEIIEKKGVDILVTDIKMPKFNGIDLAIKAKSISPSMQIVFITGYEGLIKDNDKHEQFSNCKVMRKPFPINSIISLIKELSA